MSAHWSVIVTGAGGGIGQATTHRFVAAGARVLAVDLNGDGLEATHKSASDPACVETMVADVADAAMSTAIIARAVSAFGGLDTLVNNAGIGGSRSALETTDENWAQQIAVNLSSVFFMSRAGLPELERRGGSIVNTASIAGVTALVNSAGYGAAKTGVVGLTKQMAGDYGPRGIRVNAVAPGLIETVMSRKRFEADPRFAATNTDRIPLPRVGKPEDIANAIFFLASDQATYINGQVLAVDGGWTATSYSRRGAETA